jgi:hypothetical protein
MSEKAVDSRSRKVFTRKAKVGSQRPDRSCMYGIFDGLKAQTPPSQVAMGGPDVPNLGQGRRLIGEVGYTAETCVET